LVADDDPWILRMVAAVLGQRGYTVDLARDGEEAYGKALQNAPDLLITDVMMPKMDGWSLVKALRARPDLAFLPVIFLTGMTSDDDRIQGFRLGADDYMAKPFRFEELDLRVERTLGRSRMVEQVAREQIGAVDAPAPEPVDTEGSGPHVGLLGRLEQVGLSALLTLLEMERKTGILVVEREIGRPGGTRRRTPSASITCCGGRPAPSSSTRSRSTCTTRLRPPRLIFCSRPPAGSTRARAPESVSIESQLTVGERADFLVTPHTTFLLTWLWTPPHSAPLEGP
jgi:CheY-like chemotaxis protein